MKRAIIILVALVALTVMGCSSKNKIPTTSGAEKIAIPSYLRHGKHYAQ